MDLLSLAARLTLDKSQYDQGLDDASSGAKSFGEKLKSGLGTAAKIGGAAIAVASGAIVALTKSAIDNYANYEQLVGGVETLFKGSADKVQQYAANAYKTAGLSANEYMETVTSFSASLIQSLGGNTAAAADLADVAITDMADNANKMGSDISSIQVAYSGFAKQNYTMLDNLKLGYGGTKEEMERLIRDAEKLDSTFSVTHKKGKKGADEISYSYADVVKAIHVVQTNMGITGTTAKEASETIQGSLAAAKSAWANLLTGIADENADFDTLVGNFVDSVVTAAGNLLPRIEQILKGIGKLVENLAPVIVDVLPGLVKSVLPSIVSAALTMVTSAIRAIVQSLPTLIADVLPMVLQAAIDLVDSVLDLALENGDEFMDSVLELITVLAKALEKSLPKLLPKIADFIVAIAETLTDPHTLSVLIDAAITIMIALVNGLVDALPRLIEAAPMIVLNLSNAIIRNAPKLLAAGGKLIAALGQGIILAVGDLFNAVQYVLDNAAEPIWEMLRNARNWGSDLIENFIAGINSMWESLKRKVSDVGGLIKSYLGFSEPEQGPLSNFHTYAPDMMKLFAQGIKDNEHLISDQIGKSFDFGPQMPEPNGSAFIPSSRQPAQKPIQIVFMIDGVQRWVYNATQAEQQRVGVKLATGGAL